MPCFGSDNVIHFEGFEQFCPWKQTSVHTILKYHFANFIRHTLINQIRDWSLLMLGTGVEGI